MSLVTTAATQPTLMVGVAALGVVLMLRRPTALRHMAVVILGSSLQSHHNGSSVLTVTKWQGQAQGRKKPIYYLHLAWDGVRGLEGSFGA
jgi:hypothetical protein